jgi:hypothetical protein
MVITNGGVVTWTSAKQHAGDHYLLVTVTDQRGAMKRGQDSLSETSPDPFLRCFLRCGFAAVVALSIAACELAALVRTTRFSIVALALVAFLLYRFYVPYHRSRVTVPASSIAHFVYWLCAAAYSWPVILAGCHIATWYESRRGLNAWTLAATGFAYVACSLIMDFVATKHGLR